MKKQVISILLVLSIISNFVFADIEIKTINTAYEGELLTAAGITNFSTGCTDNWYFSGDGIDATAAKFVDMLPSNAPYILYGISLGGTVSRRMTQIAEERGKNVVGYIAQSSPLRGDRLANTSWAASSAGLLIASTVIGLAAFLGGVGFNALCSLIDIILPRNEFDVMKGTSSETVLRTLCEIGNDRNVDRSNAESIVDNMALPLLEAVFGEEENIDRTEYLKSVFLSSKNNVKDLDPKGNFMKNVLNAPSEIAKETKPNIKRAFITSHNGNLFETQVWNYVGPLLTNLYRERDSYWTNASVQWWLFPYWSLRALAISASIESIECIPVEWSYCVSGSTNMSSNDCFVPVYDSFNGEELGMTAQNDRGKKLDRTYSCPATSHLDYGLSFSELYNVYGRSYCRAESADQQKDSILHAVNFMYGKE